MNLSLESQFAGKAFPLLKYLRDETVTDILVNGHHSLFVERNGRLDAEQIPFTDVVSLHDFIERLLIPCGKRVDAAQPYMDGRLVDGSRFHVILPPIAPDGPIISIRKFRALADCLLSSFAPPQIIEWLEKQMELRKNLLIAGGTGTGKTTLLSLLLEKVRVEERLALVEETREIRVRHPHVVTLEARPASPDGTGEVTLRTLIRNTLRMRPDRVILGECRGGEAFDLLQAMNTGHPGSVCTLHANGALDALRRLEGLVLLSGVALPLATVRDWIANTLHGVIYLERMRGDRQITEILTLNGLEGEVYRVTPWYRSPCSESPSMRR